jgi:hypothetical protein
MVAVNPAEVIDAAQKIFLFGQSVSQQAETLGQTLADQSGMAGTDTAAKSFAAAYDPAARDLYTAIVNLGTACTNAGLMLGATAQNHNDENAAAAGQAPPDIGYLPAPTTYNTASGASLPGTSGDPSPGPWWWDLISSYVQGKLWPNGHQDRLRKTADAWHTFAQSLTANLDYGFYPALALLRKQDSEDIGSALILCEDMYTSVFDVQINAEALHSVCSDQAQNIDDAHSAIEEAAFEIIASSVIIWGIGALLAPETGGTSLGGSGLVDAAVLGRIGANIARIIEGFEGAALATAGAAAGPAAAGVRVAAAMARISQLPVTRIAAVSATGNAARLTAEEQAELTRIANETDYKKYVEGKIADGKPPRNFDDYIRARDTWRSNKIQGREWEDFVSQEHGYTREAGWDPQKYAPNGKGPGENGSRIWDFANFDQKAAVECKSGEVKPAEFDAQFATDSTMVREEGWRITWHVNQPLSPAQMAKLKQLEVETGGEFSVLVGGG